MERILMDTRQAAKFLGVTRLEVIGYVNDKILTRTFKGVSFVFFIDELKALKKGEKFSGQLPKVYTTTEAIEYLNMNVSQRHHFKRISSRKIGTMIGTSRVFTQSELDGYILTHRPEGRPLKDERTQDMVCWYDGKHHVIDTKYAYTNRQHALWRARQVLKKQDEETVDN